MKRTSKKPQKQVRKRSTTAKRSARTTLRDLEQGLNILYRCLAELDVFVKTQNIALTERISGITIDHRKVRGRVQSCEDWIDAEVEASRQRAEAVRDALTRMPASIADAVANLGNRANA